ncbi:hypothetical protein M5K25_020015 [Dendrobium thyrsiflorum]|uniref:Uncharacterized protein n=1 Tax=Dendrobium thyrsiflorum TaxID=117978 RepID=A0ABD0U9F7_DENTH
MKCIEKYVVKCYDIMPAPVGDRASLLGSSQAVLKVPLIDSMLNLVESSVIQSTGSLQINETSTSSTKALLPNINSPSEETQPLQGPPNSISTTLVVHTVNIVSNNIFVILQSKDILLCNEVVDVPMASMADTMLASIVAKASILNPSIKLKFILSIVPLGSPTGNVCWTGTIYPIFNTFSTYYYENLNKVGWPTGSCSVLLALMVSTYVSDSHLLPLYHNPWMNDKCLQELFGGCVYSYFQLPKNSTLNVIILNVFGKVNRPKHNFSQEFSSTNLNVQSFFLTYSNMKNINCDSILHILNGSKKNITFRFLFLAISPNASVNFASVIVRRRRRRPSSAVVRHSSFSVADVADAVIRFRFRCLSQTFAGVVVLRPLPLSSMSSPSMPSPSVTAVVSVHPSVANWIFRPQIGFSRSLFGFPALKLDFAPAGSAVELLVESTNRVRCLFELELDKLDSSSWLASRLASWLDSIAPLLYAIQLEHVNLPCITTVMMIKYNQIISYKFTHIHEKILVKYYLIDNQRNLGILLPSNAFLAADAVSASVNWIKAYKKKIVRHKTKWQASEVFRNNHL